MTIKHRRAFDNAHSAGFDGEFDWDFLLPAFTGTKITPMDIDAIVERNGLFLVFETKGAGVPIPLGQQITLERLVETGLFVVLVLRGKDQESINGWEVWFKGATPVIKKYCIGTSEALVAFVARWFVWASNGGHQ